MPKNNILILILICLCMLFLFPACKKEIVTVEKTGIYKGFNVFHTMIEIQLDDSDEIIELPPSILFDEKGEALYYRNIPADIAANIYYEDGKPVKAVFDIATWEAMHPTGPC